MLNDKSPWSYSRLKLKSYSSKLPPLPKTNYNSFIESQQNNLRNVHNEVYNSEVRPRLSLPVLSGAVYAPLTPVSATRPSLSANSSHSQIFQNETNVEPYILGTCRSHLDVYNQPYTSIKAEMPQVTNSHASALYERKAGPYQQLPASHGSNIGGAITDSAVNRNFDESFGRFSLSTRGNQTTKQSLTQNPAFELLADTLHSTKTPSQQMTRTKRSKWDSRTATKESLVLPAQVSHLEPLNGGKRLNIVDENSRNLRDSGLASLQSRTIQSNVDQSGSIKKLQSEGVVTLRPERVKLTEQPLNKLATEHSSSHLNSTGSARPDRRSAPQSTIRCLLAPDLHREPPNTALNEKDTGKPPTLELHNAHSETNRSRTSSKNLRLDEKTIEKKDSGVNFSDSLGTIDARDAESLQVSCTKDRYEAVSLMRDILLDRLDKTIDTIKQIKESVVFANILDKSVGETVASSVCQPLIDHLQRLRNANNEKNSELDLGLLERFGASLRSLALSQNLQGSPVEAYAKEPVLQRRAEELQSPREFMVSSGRHDKVAQSHREDGKTDDAKTTGWQPMPAPPPSTDARPNFVRKKIAASSSSGNNAVAHTAKTRSTVWSQSETKASISLEQLMPPKPAVPESGDFGFCGFGGPTTSSIRAMDVLELRDTSELVCATAGTDNLPQSSDRTISVWLLRRGSGKDYGGQIASDDDGNFQRLRTLDNGTSKSILTLTFSRDYDNLLLSSDLDFDVKLWDWETGQCLKIWRKLHTRIIHKLAFVPLTPTRIATCSADQSIKFVWIDDEIVNNLPFEAPIVENHSNLTGTMDARQRKRVQSVNANELFTSFTFAGGDVQGQTLIASLSYALRIYKMRTMQLLHTINLHELKTNGTPITAMHSHPQFDNYVLLSCDNQVRLFDLSSETMLRTFVARELLPGIRIEGKFSPCGTFVFANSSDVKSLSTRNYQLQKQKQQQWMLENAQLLSSSTLADVSGIFLWKLSSAKLARAEMRAMNNSIPRLNYVNGQVNFPTATVRNVIVASWLQLKESPRKKCLVTASTDNVIRMFM